MKISQTLKIIAITAALFAACKKETPEPATTPTATGSGMATVKGTVLAPNGKTPIAYALVYADVRTSQYNCRTAKDGSFEMKVPIATKKIFIETGDGKIFQTVITVNLTSDQTLQLPHSESILDVRGNMAYISGAYDAIQTIVHDSLGYPITQINNADLLSLSSINGYNAIFINCGADNPLDSMAYVNLQAYVAQGGSIYVSDFAVNYLLGTYNGTCTRNLGFVNDAKLCTQKLGVSGIVNNVTVNSTGLQTALGSNTVNINFDLVGWEKVMNYDASFWDVLLTDNGASLNGPLILHNHTQGGANSGHIYYTCFHNEPNGTLNPTAQIILQYIIMNL